MAIKLPSGGAGDSEFANVKLLLHLNGDLTDSSASPVSPTLSGGPGAFGSGLYGQGFAFDGFGGFIAVPSSSFAIGTGEFVLEMWINTTSLSGTKYLYDLDNYTHFCAVILRDDQIEFYHDGFSAAVSAAITANEWHHVAVSRSAGVIRVFVDGVASAATYNFSESLTFSSHYICGTSGFDAGTFNGSIDEVRLTVGSDRGFTGATIPVPTAAFPDSAGSTGDISGLYLGSTAVSAAYLGSSSVWSAASGWDISTATYVQSFSVSSEEAGTQGVHFKPDGTKMYIVGSIGDEVNEYDLSSAWDISTASYAQNFSVSGQEGAPFGLFFKPDGTKMYVVGVISDSVHEYDLSSAWDISTASFAQSLYVAFEDGIPTDIFFKPDGTKLYIVGNDGNDVNEYNLSTAWDISTDSFTQSFSVSSQDNTPTGIFFKDDGTKMYIVGGDGDDINEYALGTAWDISTASFTQNFSVASQDTIPTGIFFKPDGAKMYVAGDSGDNVYQYDLA